MSVVATAGARGRGAKGGLDGYVLGVPARIMLPRIVLVVTTIALICFGLVMIYSASSVEALSELGDANYYLIRQAICIGLGLVLGAVVLHIDYHSLCNGPLLIFICVAVMLMLLAVRFVGSDANGAVRWVQIGPVRLQPSEFAKVSVLLAAAHLGNLFDNGKESLSTLFLRAVLLLGLPLILIFIQPDKGTTGIIGVMLVAVLCQTDIPRELLVGVVGVLGVAGLVVTLVSGYSFERIVTMFDPWLDAYGSGYQLTRGFMAFGSGGLFGKGLGLSRMKYSYLPEAHNDIIFAIIGEELGLVGTLGTLALFFAFAWAGYQVARNASDKTGRFVAFGATTLIMVQFFLNVMGVLGCFPLSGKPLPFISYGGSSIMSCILLVACIINVSRNSTLPETVYERRLRAMTLADDEDTGVGEAHPRGEGAGMPMPRSARGSVPLAGSAAARRGLRVVEGGAGARAGGDGAEVAGDASAQRRGSAGDRQGGYSRIDLGPSASERLRPNSGPRRRG